MTFALAYGIISGMDASTEALNRIVQAVLVAAKYDAICPDTVRRLAAQELPKRRSFKAALKATKRRLHQIYGAFEQKADYDALYRRLAHAYGSGNDAAIRAACRQALGLHSSTQERLSILEKFYARIWSVTGVPRALLDMGCGLNPLALPWMDLPPTARYLALDIDAARIDFLNRYFALAGLPPLARWQDLLCEPPASPVDVALLLKTSTTLEQQEEGAPLRLLRALSAPFVVVSFPIRSLGGREKGMATHYRREFQALVADEPWSIRELRFETELVFVVSK
jgi:16S rRNA (guanine(1405)-N(7))-methyltransferase